MDASNSKIVLDMDISDGVKAGVVNRLTKNKIGYVITIAISLPKTQNFNRC